MPPEGITAVTFTHRAADEMRQRLQAAGGAAQRVWVGTFHRFCLDLLAPRLRRSRRWSWTNGRRRPSWRRRTPQRKRARGPVSPVNLPAQGPGHPPDSPAVPAALREIYRLYEERLSQLGACDYDGLLLGIWTSCRTDEGVLARGPPQAGHLLVDEFQDINAVQYHLTRILAGDGGHLFAIGDPDQAIYGFAAPTTSISTSCWRISHGASVCRLAGTTVQRPHRQCGLRFSWHGGSCPRSNLAASACVS